MTTVNFSALFGKYSRGRKNLAPDRFRQDTMDVFVVEGICPIKTDVVIVAYLPNVYQPEATQNSILSVRDLHGALTALNVPSPFELSADMRVLWDVAIDMLSLGYTIVGLCLEPMRSIPAESIDIAGDALEKALAFVRFDASQYRHKEQKAKLYHMSRADTDGRVNTHPVMSANTPMQLQFGVESAALSSAVEKRAAWVSNEIDIHADTVQANVKAEVRKILSKIKYGSFYESTPQSVWEQALSENRPSKLASIPMDEYEYAGAQVEEFGGIPQDTSYAYISNTFLNGMVNYGRNHRPFLIARYGIQKDPEDESIIERIRDEKYDPLECLAEVRRYYQEYADAQFAEIHPVMRGDDWLLGYETLSSYIWMWYDMDCSDCCVARYSKESCADVGITSLDQFVLEALIDWKDRSSDYCKDCAGLLEPVVVEPKVNAIHGWLGG